MAVRMEHLKEMQKTGRAYSNEIREVAAECIQSREAGGPIIAPILREISFALHTLRPEQSTVFVHDGKTFVLKRST